MKIPADKRECVALLSKAHLLTEQRRLRDYIRGEPDYIAVIASVYCSNPFFVLEDDELAAITQRIAPEPLRWLIAAREAASRSTTTKVAVFCMPKSGSSFVQSAIGHALAVPTSSVTSFGTSFLASTFGGNSREQELDELGLIKSIIACEAGFVCQAHTRYSTYLALQLHRFHVTPIVTVRNILDCIVSFDEMMLAWRKQQPGDFAWIGDGPFALPLNYGQLDDATRYDVLARSYGVWLISFYLSWSRARRQEVLQPILVRYEQDVLNTSRLVEKLSVALDMSEEQRTRLAQYVDNPDPVRSRINVGAKGRGREKVPNVTARWLEDYAQLFSSELSGEDVAYLLA